MQKSLTLPSKELLKLVEKRLSEGVTKENIFQELGPNDDFAKFLAHIPYPQKKERYKILNNILFGIVLLYALERAVLAFLAIKALSLPMMSLVIYLIYPLIAFLLALEVRKYRVGLYIVIAIWGIIALFQSFPQDAEAFQRVNWTIWFSVNIPLVTGIMLTFFLRFKLCPNLGLFLPKKDENENYVLS